MSFHLFPSAIDPGALQRALRNERAGAYVTFEGWVRDHNDGRSVRSLDYEAFLPLAEKEGGRILDEARAKFHLLAAMCAHRTGSLALGDLAVWVGVTAEHRGAAFEACRYIIDEAKARVPIWKREHYADGSSVWINSATRGDFANVKHGE